MVKGAGHGAGDGSQRSQKVQISRRTKRGRKMKTQLIPKFWYLDFYF